MTTRTLHEQSNAIGIVGPFVFNLSAAAGVDKIAVEAGFTTSYSHLVRLVYASFISSLTVYVNSGTTAANTTFKIVTTTDSDISAGNPPTVLSGITVNVATTGSGYTVLPVSQLLLPNDAWVGVAANCATAGKLVGNVFIVLGV